MTIVHARVGRLADAELKQPDRLSCGASVAVAAELIDSTTPDDALGWKAADFRALVLSKHHELTGGRTATGRMQLPWPRFLGTPPWALANELSARTGVTYRTVTLRTLTDLSRAKVLQDTVPPAVLYVGSKWLPRHVVLIVGQQADRLTIYEPARGEVIEIDPADPPKIAGWNYLWFAVAASK